MIIIGLTKTSMADKSFLAQFFVWQSVWISIFIKFCTDFWKEVIIQKIASDANTQVLHNRRLLNAGSVRISRIVLANLHESFSHSENLSLAIWVVSRISVSHILGIYAK